MKDGGGTGVVSQDRCDIIISFPGVNDCGLPKFGCERELGLERTMLGGPRRMIVVKVQAGFTDSYDGSVPKQVSKPGFGGGTPVNGMVRMDARRGREAWLFFDQSQRGFGRVPGLANNHHPAHPGGPGPLEHLGAIGSVRRIGEVAVGVDQHGGKDGKGGKVGKVG